MSSDRTLLDREQIEAIRGVRSAVHSEQIVALCDTALAYLNAFDCVEVGTADPREFAATIRKLTEERDRWKEAWAKQKSKYDDLLQELDDATDNE